MARVFVHIVGFNFFKIVTGLECPGTSLQKPLEEASTPGFRYQVF